MGDNSLLNFSGNDKINLGDFKRKSKSIITSFGDNSENDNPEEKKNIREKITGKLTAKDIIVSLYHTFDHHKYMIANSYIFNWESDFFMVTDTNYIYEFEIKISRSDFKDDFNKKEKHLLLENSDPSGDISKPNKFFYVTPRGLLSTIEIPEYAGLIEVESAAEDAKTIKNAPFIHRTVIFPQYKDKLLDKYSYRYKEELLKKYQNALNNLEDS